MTSARRPANSPGRPGPRSRRATGPRPGAGRAKARRVPAKPAPARRAQRGGSAGRPERRAKRGRDPSRWRRSRAGSPEKIECRPGATMPTSVERSAREATASEPRVEASRGKSCSGDWPPGGVRRPDFPSRLSKAGSSGSVGGSAGSACRRRGPGGRRPRARSIATARWPSWVSSACTRSGGGAPDGGGDRRVEAHEAGELDLEAGGFGQRQAVRGENVEAPEQRVHAVDGARACLGATGGDRVHVHRVRGRRRGRRRLPGRRCRSCGIRARQASISGSGPDARRDSRRSRGGSCGRASRPRRTSPAAGRAGTWCRRAPRAARS